jgi:Domain of unknown function (DUF4397)
MTQTSSRGLAAETCSGSLGRAKTLKNVKSLWRWAFIASCLALISGIICAPASSAATGTGWIRFGNLSESSAFSSIDIYVSPSPAGGAGPQREASGYTYGTVSDAAVPFPAGSYTVDFRKAGASATTAPIASQPVTVTSGGFYLVAPIDVAGQSSARHVLALSDAASSSAGDGYVRAIDAASKTGKVTFHCSCASGAPGNILTDVQVGSANAVPAIPAGNWTMTATAASENASLLVPLSGSTARTEIVLDSSNGGIQILNLLDTVGGTAAKVSPATGLGGTAPRGPGSPLPWLLVIGAGSLLVIGGGLGLSRMRPRRQVSRG